MKTTIKSAIAVLFASTVLCSCETIENKYDFDQTNPISAQELKQALEFHQFENKDGEVVGDQYIIVRNNRPDIGGTWHLVHNGSELTYSTDHDTIICTDNGEFELYYQGISKNTIVKTEPFTFTVTNVFDEWSNYFTGAENKADKTASKTWIFRGVKSGDSQLIALNGGYGVWNYAEGDAIDALIASNAWWNNHTIQEAANYEWKFDYENNKLTVTNASGAPRYEGTFSFTHNAAETGVLGELITDVPLFEISWDDCNVQNNKNGKQNVYWIIRFDGEILTLAHPDTFGGGVDWDNCAFFGFLQAKK